MLKNLYHKGIAILLSKKIHLICWAIFIFYEVVITGILLGHFSPLLSYILFYTINISLFYMHSLFVLPYAFENTLKSLWRAPILLMFELSVYFILTALAEKLINISLGTPAQPANWKFAAAAVWRGTYFMLYGTGYYFLTEFIKNEKRINKEAIEKVQLNNRLLRSEKDFLRAQINPHLLFNTLNFIKYASKRKPEDVEVAIFTLAEIMSFAMDENNSEFLILGTELKQIRNVIKLNQLRYENSLNLEFSTDVFDEGILIIPIVLLTLTENVFKHGDLLSQSNPAIIKINSSIDHLSFHSRNLASSFNSSEQKSNRGLKNIRSRLNTYYPGKYTFDYGVKNDCFVVDLSIHL